ncbi:hypothetical protein [Mycolicibacterium septicum]|uniref:hypothetical protein n=1 Tax=Mycolicibacterium septicum TaxID=98668 RepID=UPI002E27FAA4|nr:hypothetical protein [Mycolicibacterium septicum]
MADAIGRCCEHSGFLLLVGHGVPEKSNRGRQPRAARVLLAAAGRQRTDRGGSRRSACPWIQQRRQPRGHQRRSRPRDRARVSRPRREIRALPAGQPGGIRRSRMDR